MPRLEPLFKVQNCREKVDDPNEEDPVVLLFVSYLVIYGKYYKSHNQISYQVYVSFNDTCVRK